MAVRRSRTAAVLLVSLLVVAGGCSFDIANPNSPDIIGQNPTRSQVAATATISTLPRADPPCYALDEKARCAGGFWRLRGKDSNLDYLIQSQASYH